jgi:SAM-dependent methyltransferase
MAALPSEQESPNGRTPFIVAESGRAIYQDGRYLEQNPTWHIEESPFKVGQILRMLKQQNLTLKTVCDVGCGAGLVLAELRPYLPKDCICCGYDISPDAIAMCRNRAHDNLQFFVCDIRRDPCDAFFDLLLMLDVFEHVEDYIGLVRDVRFKARYKLFHIPLDLSVQAAIRKNGFLKRRDNYAHLHYFTKETALRTLTDVGYELVDYFYTPRCIELGEELIQKIARVPRKLCFALAPDVSVRILGGYSLMVLAK